MKRNSVRTRVLAMMLMLMMIITSSGMQVLANEVEPDSEIVLSTEKTDVAQVEAVEAASTDNIDTAAEETAVSSEETAVSTDSQTAETSTGKTEISKAGDANDIDVTGPKIEIDPTISYFTKCYIYLAKTVNGEQDYRLSESSDILPKLGRTNLSVMSDGEVKTFYFTLKADSGNENESCWDGDFKNPITTEGTTTSIMGARNSSMTVYFNKPGTYKYTLYEEDIKTDDGIYGYSKDNTVYDVTIVVKETEDGAYLEVESATYKKQGGGEVEKLSGDNPITFNNLYRESTTLTLKDGTKVLEGDRDKAIQENEFTFSVYEVVSEGENGSTKEEPTTVQGRTEAGEEGSDTARIVFGQFEYTKNDLGKHTYIIRENEGTDKKITYSKEAVTVEVNVYYGADGLLTADAQYKDDVKFTNVYKTKEAASTKKTNSKSSKTKDTGTTTETTSTTTVKTGDDTPMGLYLMLFGVSAIMILLVEEKRRRFGKTEK